MTVLAFALKDLIMQNSKHGLSQELNGWLKLVFLLLFQVTDCHIPDISRQWDYIIQFFLMETAVTSNIHDL